MKKSYFITGANGWIGLEVITLLLNRGEQVKALVRKDSLDLNELNKKFKNLTIIYGDLKEIDLWENHLTGTDILIHLGAKVHSYVKTIEEAKEFNLINYVSTKELFIKAEKSNVNSFIFVSSVAVQDLKETDVSLQNAYAKSKKKAELFLLDATKVSNMKISIVRPVTIYGGNDRGNFKRLYKLSRKGFFPMIGNEDNVKSVIYYKDFAFALINVSINSKKANKKIVTIGTEKITMLEIFNNYKKNRKIIIKLNISLKIMLFASRIIGIFNKKLSLKLNKQVNTLSHSNIYDLEDGKVFLPKKLTYFNDIDFDQEYSMKRID